MAGHGPNVSLSPKVGLYFTELSGGTMLQATDAQGNILFTTVTRDGAVHVLPIGTISELVNVAVDTSSGMKSLSIEEKDVIQCPCHSEVVYDGPNGTIIWIINANGDIAQVIVLPPRKIPN